MSRPQTITGGVLILDGSAAHQSSFSEIEFPEIEYNTEEYDSPALPGTPEVITGIGAINMTITWLYAHPEITKAMAHPTVATAVQVRSTLRDVATGAVSPFITFLRTRAMKYSMGTLEKEDFLRPETEFAVDYIRQVISGQETYYLDVLDPNGLRINGKLVNLTGGA